MVNWLNVQRRLLITLAVMSQHQQVPMRELGSTSLLVRWWLAMLLAPFLVLQGLFVRRVTRKLPVPDGPTCGEVDGAEPSLSLLIVGESPVAGIGVEHQSCGVAARTADRLQRLSGRRVVWQAFGWDGIKASQLRLSLAEIGLLRADVAIVAMGVNDTTKLTSLRRWRYEILTLITLLRELNCTGVFLSAIPSMEHFSALPRPLNYVLGVRAALLDRVLRKFTDDDIAGYIAAQVPLEPEYLAVDGYHPSSLGCEVWATELAQAVYRQAKV